MKKVPRLPYYPAPLVADLLGEETRRLADAVELRNEAGRAVDEIDARRAEIRADGSLSALQAGEELRSLEISADVAADRLERAHRDVEARRRVLIGAERTALGGVTGVRRIREKMADRPHAARLADLLAEVAAEIDEVLHEDGEIIGGLVGAGLLPGGTPIDSRRFPTQELAALRNFVSLPDVVVDVVARVIADRNESSPFALRVDEMDERTAERVAAAVHPMTWTAWQEKTGNPRPLPNPEEGRRKRTAARRDHAVSVALSAVKKTPRPPTPSDTPEVPEGTREEVPA